MTKLRAPLSIDAGLTHVAETLRDGWREMAEITGRKEGLVRSWGDPDRREQVPLRDAVLLDRACAAAGGGTPLFAYYADRLDTSGSHAPADAGGLGRLAATVARECGEAEAALIEATLPGASSADLREACREIEEAIAVMRRALPMLSCRASAGDGLHAVADTHPATGPPAAA